MKLVSGSDIRLRLGFSSNVDTLVAASDNAAEEASLHLENLLRTPLTQTDYEDLFLIKAMDRTQETLVLKLTAGFISGDVLIGTGLTEEEAVADESVSDSGYAVVNREMGTITLSDNLTVSKYLSVRYTAGFPAADAPNTDNMYDLTDVPAWLIKLAELKAISVMGESPELDNKDGKLIDGRSFGRQYAAMAERYIRYFPTARLPTR